MEKKKKSFWSQLKDKLSKKKDKPIDKETDEEFEGDDIKYWEFSNPGVPHPIFSAALCQAVDGLLTLLSSKILSSETPSGSLIKSKWKSSK